MADILIAACPPIGHVAPLLNVARGLVIRGHDVTFLTSARHARQDPGGRRDTAPTAIRRGLRRLHDRCRSAQGVPKPRASRGSTSTSSTSSCDRCRIRQPRWTELTTTRRFDAVIADAFFLGVLPMLLGDRASRPPVLTYTTTPLFLTSRDTAPGGTGILPGAGALGRLRNRVLNLASQKALLRPSHRAAEVMLDALGQPKLPVFVLDSGVLGDRMIVPTIPEFEYHRSDLPDHVRFVGAVTPQPTDGFVAPALVARVATDRPVVHVTQGTIDNADLGRLIEPTIEALADEDVTVVVTTGGRPISQLRNPLPAEHVRLRVHPARHAAALGRRDGDQRRLRRRAAGTDRPACRWWWRAIPRTSPRSPRASNGSVSASICGPAGRAQRRCATRCERY